MINFFRKIRKQMADDNPPAGEAGKPIKPALPVGRYMRYAIGEIVLVVIGILIALYINNWNEERLVSEIEKKTLMDLNIEFEKNQQLLETKIFETNNGLRAMDVLLDRISPDLTGGEIDTLDQLVASFIYIPKYTPIKDVYNSGNVKIIKNIELQYKLSNWNRDLETYNYWIKIVTTIVTEHCLPFLYENYNTANYGVPETFKPLQRSKFKHSPLKLLGSSRFENLVAQRRLITVQLGITSMTLQKSQKEISNLINEELQE